MRAELEARVAALLGDAADPGAAAAAGFSDDGGGDDRDGSLLAPSEFKEPDTGFDVAQYRWFAENDCFVTPWGAGPTPRAWGGALPPNVTGEHNPKYAEKGADAQ